MRDAKQLLVKWIHRKKSTPLSPPSTPPAPNSPLTNNSTAGLIDAEKSANIVEAVLDNLSLVLSLAEQVADIAQAAPFIAPAAALLSEILISYNEVKSTNEKRDALVTYIANLTGDICATILRVEVTHHSDLIRRLKLDLEKYAAIITKASLFIRKYDDQGKFVQFAGRNQLGGEIDKLNEELSSFQARFGTNRLVDLAISHSATTRTLQKVHDMVVVEKLEKWLQFPPDMMQKQRDTEKLRKDGTGLWFLEGSTFIEWQDNAGSLWIEGPSGAGKSVLSSTVIKELFSEEKLLEHGDKPSCPAVAFFYFDFRNKEAQSIEIALRRIVLQLSAHSPDPYRALHNHYELSNGQKLPGYEDLCKVLQQLFRELGRTYIVLDALDECDDGDFSQLVDLVSMLREWIETPLHLFFASQTRQIFTEGFRGIPCIALGSDSTQEDIEFFVGSEIRSNPKLKIWRPQVDQIIDRVARKSQGMFRLAACLVIELSFCKWEDEMDETLENLPDTLFAVYDRFIEKIRKKEWVYAEAVLRWLMFSAQRLNLDQLADAIAFDFSNSEQYIYKPSRRERNASTIFDWLEGLVVKSTYYGDSVVALAHASVHDYLLSQEFTVKFGHNLNEPLSHTFLSRTCITHLVYLCNHPLELASEALLILHYPLAKYAADYWLHHLVQSHNRSVLSTAAVELLVDWSQRYDDVRGSLAPQTPPVASALYLCCQQGYTEGVQGLLTNDPIRSALAIRDRRVLWTGSAGDRTPVSKGSYTFVIRLLESNVTFEDSGNALEFASDGGSTEIMELLLKSGADPNSRSQQCRSALEVASSACNIEMVRLLLESGADPNLRREKHESALELASDQSSTKIMELLLKSGANPNSRSQQCRSALEVASSACNIEMVRLLLESGADPNLRREKYGSALELASAGGSTEMVHLLLKNGADVISRSQECHNALEVASSAGNTETVRLLLESGADPNLRSQGYDSALELASAGGSTEIIHLLLKSGADPNSPSQGCRNALEVASLAGNTEVVRLLLESGADPRRKWQYDNALELAVLAGNSRRVQLLLENGAGTKDYSMALHLATWKGDTDIMRLLLEHGADPHLQTAHRRSVIEVACDAGRTELVRLLLGKETGTAQGGKLLALAEAANGAYEREIADFWRERGASQRKIIRVFHN
ncbi:hypothetical protein DFH07DRAFT_914759 [Mycena maculata]|uniref:Nephrocystin 3-like N-terminal domain-containing protein n=1 Tax=Mycena maculata TaxID=230809 RepID=A0AAD7JUN9_9AGAR|nr:hypothetical protein DFH07DRAFT_914759 [Mycena maculata]